jgi:hypothetical protein
MKPVLAFVSMVGVFCLVFYLTGHVFLAVFGAFGWLYLFGRWVHGPQVWKRASTESLRDAESLYAYSSLDYNASPTARSFARLREEAEEE